MFSIAMQEPGPHVRVALRLTRVFARYFRYECEGFENLALQETALLVGYHGRPWPFDLVLLCERMHRELGQLPQPIWAKPMRWAPVLRGLVDEVGGLYSYPSPSQVEELKARRRHLVVLPGGLREGLRPFWAPRVLDWGARRGYLRLAWQHRLPIVPVVASGVDHSYLGINNGYRLSKRLFGTGDVPLWLGIGLGGLWPLALPWPIKIRQRIGAPIRLEEIRPACRDEDEFLARAHERVSHTLQAMLDSLP
jgi:1-acyl-sn-glycerol-3-phosphate acyltransferase